MFIGRLQAGAKLANQLAAGRAFWIQMISGEIAAMNQSLLAGDAASIEQLAQLELNAKKDSSFLLFDLA